ncbi:MAG: glycosyltransferase family 2 protein [Gemmatirosa sp.]
MRRPVPHVVVVILNWCGEEDTAACVRSVLASDYPRVTVLLVDNGSPDGSGARLRDAFPDVPYLQTGANLGYTGGNNRGFEWAREQDADHVVVLNNDTEIDPGCISSLVRAAEADPEVGGVAPRILVHGLPDRVWYAGGDLSLARGAGLHRLDDAPRHDGAPLRPVSFMTGCCFLLTRRAIDAVEGFEESFFAYNEDTDLSWRLSRAGFRMVYEPRALLTHKVGDRPEEPSPFQIVQRDRNRRRFVDLRLGAVDRARFAAWFYPTRLVHLGRYAARRDWARCRAVWQGMVT